ncbi:hypothetical protein GGX14DRAFT_437131 [Mycena pura]|uniref:DUF6533 domain-containing protein n=1 Tax=Mycena pura TaxID=153505 RepID=A0AAD6YFG0_9AGAR|nr:hypothetical protein GGX14DRAFT_437131 [Mycena pura]
MTDVSASLVAGYTGDVLAEEVQALASMEGSILALRFMSAVAVSALFCDHVLTLGDEIELIWYNRLAKPGNRVAFILNRYLTEIMVCYVAYVMSGASENMGIQGCHIFMWLFTVCSILFVGGSHAVLMGQLYILWDRRTTMKWIISGSFVIAMLVATLFFVLSAIGVQASTAYSTQIHMCVFTKKPWAMDFSLGVLTFFDLFIILMTVANGFHRPYKTESDVLLALLRDGAAMFVALFVLRCVNLLMGLFGNPSNTFVTMIFIWSMCSVVSSRIQLRVEALNIDRKIPEEKEAVDIKPDAEWGTPQANAAELKIALKHVVPPARTKFSLTRAISKSASMWFE